MNLLRHCYPDSPPQRLSTAYPALNLPALARCIILCSPAPSLSTERLFSQTEIVDRAVLLAVKKYGEEGNLLSLGYRLSRGQGALKSGVELECRVPNWIVSFFKQKEWTAILDAIGDRAMLELLVNGTLFLQDSGLSQLTGLPLPKTLTRIGRDLLKPSGEPRRVLRDRVLYCSRRLEGLMLPATHVLNRLVTGHAEQPRSEWAAVSKTQARRLALVISDNADGPRLDMAWKGMLPHLQALLERQRRVPYARLFAAHCRETLAPHGQVAERAVSAYIKKVVARAVPRALLGRSKRARRRVLCKVGLLVRLGRGDKLLVREELMHGVKLGEFDFISSDVSLRKRTRVLESWLEFLFNEFVCGVLKASFYVTEGEPGGLLYFSKQGWARLATQHHRDLGQLFEPAPPLADKRKTGLAQLRLVPKTDGSARVIMNLGRASPGGLPSINQACRPAFHTLKHEQAKDAIHGLDDIHTALSAYARARGGLRNAHCVALDLRKCFDSILHGKLMPLVERELRSDEYAASSHSTSFVNRAMQRARTRVVWRVSADGRFEPVKVPRRAVRADGIARWFFKRDRVRALVKDCVENNCVQTPYGLRRQTRGIPQGSILSSLLCNLYFGAADKAKTEGVVHGREDLLMRLVDDYCLLTPSRERALAFVERMSRVDAEWGAEVNVDKTKSSLEASEEGCWVSWCGMLFHYPTGRLRVAFDKTLGGHAPPVDLSRGGLARAMRAALGVKLHALFLDADLQSRTECAVNVGQIFVVAAKRFHAWTRRKRARPLLGGLRAILDLFDYCFALARARCHKRCIRPFGLSRAMVRALGGWAFFAVLKKSGLHRSSGVAQRMLSLARKGPARAKVEGIEWIFVKKEVEELAQKWALKG